MKISQKLGILVVDNYANLVGEFNATDDISIDK